MVSIRSSSPTIEGTNNSDDIDTMVKMHVAMEELRHHNQMLEENIYNIKQRQQEVNPPKVVEQLDL